MPLKPANGQPGGRAPVLVRPSGEGEYSPSTRIRPDRSLNPRKSTHGSSDAVVHKPRTFKLPPRWPQGTPARGTGAHPRPNLRRAWAHRCHVCTGTGPARAPILPPAQLRAEERAAQETSLCQRDALGNVRRAGSETSGQPARKLPASRLGNFRPPASLARAEERAVLWLRLAAAAAAATLPATHANSRTGGRKRGRTSAS